MVVIGRSSGKKRPYNPNNKNMFERANNQLEAHAASHALKHREALKVDGPRFAFWRKLSGSIPCSCSAKHEASSPQAHVSPGEVNSSNSHSSGTHKLGDSKGRLTYLGTQDNDDFDEDFIEGPIDKITNRNGDGQRTNVADDEDILDAIDGSIMSEDPNLMDFDDPFGLFGNKIIDCPICFGQSYQDSWQLHNGLRLVLDTSNAYGFDIRHGSVDNSAAGPARMSLTTKGEIYWTAKLPMFFNEVVRVRVYNGVEVIDPELYVFQWIDEDNNLEGEVNEDDLLNLIGIDKSLTLVLKNAFDQELNVTHAEIIINFAPFDHCQLPEVPAAYEEQFLDWNVSTSAEVPSDLEIKEGDYFCDDKYHRTWKINSINRRVTAGGNQFGSSLDIRVLHSFERLFGVLNIFPK